MRQVIMPPTLNQGDKVIIIAPSRSVLPSEIIDCKNWLLQLGLTVIEGPNLYSQWNQYAGNHQQRLTDLQWALNHKEAKAIILARGGFGMAHLVDELKSDSICQFPKWVIGFSDATMLGLVMNRWGLPFVHGPVARTWPKTNPKDLEALHNLLFKGVSDWQETAQNPTLTNIEAPLVGGNLTLITHSLGTQHSFLMPNGALLFLEEVGEYHYHIDRMFNQLKRSGILNKASAIILGAFSDLKDSPQDFGMGVVDLLRHFIPPQIPIIENFPAGHQERNSPLLLGATYVLAQTSNTLSLKIKKPLNR